MTDQVIIDPTSTRRTIYGSTHQTAMTLNIPVPYQEKDTLNELYDVLAGEYPAAGQYTSLGYFQLGINGAYMKATEDGREELESYVHQPTDGGLFMPIPFVVRRTNNDLTAEERKDYAGRTKRTYDGVEYYVYMFKRLDTSATTITRSIVDPVNGTENEFTPSSDTLQPTPQRPSVSAENIVSGSYCKVSAIITMPLKAWQLDELISAKQIITGSTSLDINEIAICLGKDYPTTIDENSNTVAFTEAIAVQPTAYFPNRFNLNSYVGSDFSMRFNAGIDDPMSLSVASLS